MRHTSAVRRSWSHRSSLLATISAGIARHYHDRARTLYATRLHQRRCLLGLLDLRADAPGGGAAEEGSQLGFGGVGLE